MVKLFIPVPTVAVLANMLYPFLLNIHDPQFIMKKWDPPFLINKPVAVDAIWNIHLSMLGPISCLFYDCAIFGFLIYACAQIDVLRLRLLELPKDIQLACSKILDPREIYKIEENKINDIIRYHQHTLK